MNTILELKNISKCYNIEKSKQYIINDINITANKGDVIAIVGPSGSGKSTILQIAGLIDTPTTGKVFFNNEDVSMLNDSKRTHIRRKHIGFIYQFHYLLPELSVIQNIALPKIIQGNKYQDSIQEMIDILNIRNIVNSNVSTLSGGERQRIAIARALIHKPQVVLADEPTGSLDHKNSQEVFELFIKAAKYNNATIIIVTHNHSLINKIEKVVYLESGSQA